MRQLAMVGKFTVSGLCVFATVYMFLAPNAAGFKSEELARILFFHLPCALVSAGLVFVATYWAWRVLSKPSRDADLRFAASWELATVMALLTLTTGMVFSQVQWGAWWSWDPRQTSYLFVTLLLLGGLALRGGLSDPQRRMTASAGYALLNLIPIAFLTFVYPRLPQTQSLHPSNTIASGGLDASYRVGVYLGFFAIAGLTILLWRRRVKAGEFEFRLENRNGNLEADRGGSAADGVRGPVVVPRKR